MTSKDAWYVFILSRYALFLGLYNAKSDYWIIRNISVGPDCRHTLFRPTVAILIQFARRPPTCEPIRDYVSRIKMSRRGTDNSPRTEATPETSYSGQKPPLYIGPTSPRTHPPASLNLVKMYTSNFKHNNNSFVLCT